MTIEQMRSALVAMYPGAKWRERVLNMPDYQVVAVYSRKTLKDNPK